MTKKETENKQSKVKMPWEEEEVGVGWGGVGVLYDACRTF